MTEEELDRRAEDIAREALRAVGLPVLSPGAVAIEAAKLALTGWKPEDPDLIEAREIAITHGGGSNEAWVAHLRSGAGDEHVGVKVALAAIKATKAKYGVGQ